MPENPRVINPAGFHYIVLDSTVATVVLPMRQRLEARGERLFVNLVATADRLAGAGFRPVFIAPSTADLGRSLAYLNDIYRVPGVHPLLKELSNHRYRVASQENLAALAASAKAVGARTAMLEHIGSGVEDLDTDLTIGQVSAWQQYTLAFPSPDNVGHYFGIEDGRPVPGDRTRYHPQYFHYVRMGAQRIGAQSTTTSVRVVAFENANHRLAVVVHADRFGPVEVRGLRPGNYGVSATTRSQTCAELGDQIAGATGTLTFTAPGAGVMTVYSK